MEPTNTPCRLGRSDPDARREHILAVATDVFAQDGYGSTSMSTIAARLGGSKATLYKYFPSKEVLFEAVMNQRCAKVLTSLRAVTDGGCTDLEELLFAYGSHFIRALLQPESLEVYRMVQTDGLRFPEVARSFFRSGPDQGYIQLASTLAHFAERGEIDCPDLRLAAEQFLAMVRADLHMRVVIGVRSMPDCETIDRHVAQAARIFARGLRPKADRP